jgi:hypothetical protein
VRLEMLELLVALPCSGNRRVRRIGEGDTGGGAQLGGGARAAQLGLGCGLGVGGGGLNRTGHLLACGPRLGRRVQGGDGGGAVESGLGTPEVGDDSVGPAVSDRERRGPVGLYWAASESGLRPTAVGGEGDKGARADFRGRAWPK